MTNSAKKARRFNAGAFADGEKRVAIASAQELLDRRFGSGASLPGFNPDEFRCAAMTKDGSSVEKRQSSSAATEPVCGKLRLMFDDAAAEPMPDALACLFDRLDIALERGELFGAKPEKRRG